MFKRIFTLAGIVAAVGVVPLGAQGLSKFSSEIGGGISTPLNPTAQFTGISGNFVAGAGYNIDRHNAIIGEFMWSGLPPNITALHPVNAPFGHINLYSLTANYRYQRDRLGHSPFGAYFVAGGGWYDRYSSIDKNYFVPPFTICQPIYTWWGYGCGTDGYVYTATIASRGASSGGVNGGLGFTIRLSDSGWKFYIESRYHYAFSPHIPTTLVPVTFGIKFN